MFISHSLVDAYNRRDKEIHGFIFTQGYILMPSQLINQPLGINTVQHFHCLMDFYHSQCLVKKKNRRSNITINSDILHLIKSRHPDNITIALLLFHSVSFKNILFYPLQLCFFIYLESAEYQTKQSSNTVVSNQMFYS